MATRWYVVHVYSGFERKVAQSIREQAQQKGMADQFVEVLVPTEEVVELRRGAKVNAERKFFPGYVLIKMDMSDESWHLVKNTPKVTGFLGGKGRPTPISEAEAALAERRPDGRRRVGLASRDLELHVTVDLLCHFRPSFPS